MGLFSKRPRSGTAAAEIKVRSAEDLGPYLLMGLNVHSNLLLLIRDGGKVGGGGYLCPTTYPLRRHHQNDSALRRAAVGDILMFP